MSVHLTWSAIRATRPLTAAEQHTLGTLREDQDTEPAFRSFLEGLPAAFPGVTWHALIETESRHFIFFEVDDSGVFPEHATFSVHRQHVEPPPRSSDDDFVVAECTPGTGPLIAELIERAWERDGGDLVVAEDRIRIPLAWRSRGHVKWAFESMVPHLVEPLALVVHVDRWRGEQLTREHYSVVLRGGGAALRPVWLVVADDDEWTSAAQALVTRSD